MKTVLALAGILASNPALANPVDANHCEAFVNHVEVSRAGVSYAGTVYFTFGIKVLNERVGGGISHVEAYVDNEDFPYRWHVEQTSHDYYEVKTVIGSYFPVTFGSGDFHFYAVSHDGVFYRIKPSVGAHFVIDENAYAKVRDQGTITHDPYFTASANTQDGAFGGYYNPQNCK